MGGLLSVPTTTSSNVVNNQQNTQSNLQQIPITQTTQSQLQQQQQAIIQQQQQQQLELQQQYQQQQQQSQQQQTAPQVISVNTEPVNTTMTSEQAALIENKQNAILQQSIPGLISQASSLIINTSTTNEGFIGEMQDPVQTPIRLPASATPELDDYINYYNKSVALLDDPNRFAQANFDAYIHMQDIKLNDLQDSIASFPTSPSTGNYQIKSIKNLKTSSLLNVEPYPDPRTQTSLPTSYRGNGAVNYPNYVIYGNNGCVQYSPQSSDGKTAAAWSFQPCNSNLPGQRFNMQQINNLNNYNAKITNPDNLSYRISDPNSSVFGFYVVNPEGYTDQCLQLNQDGLSVMPCNMDSSQRFKPYYHNISQ